MKIDISYIQTVYTNPRFGTLARYGGNVSTLSINANSPTQNIGLYIRRVQSSIPYSYYYSNDNINWFTDPRTHHCCQ